MTRKQRRGVLIGVCLSVLMTAVGLVLFALRDSIVFFHTPSDIAEKPIEAGQRFRLGGLVAAGSVKRGEGTKVDFVVTDTLKDIPVTYEGVLPDLFREGQGVVAEGKLSAGWALRCRHGAGQARRDLHAAGGGEGAAGEGREARQGRDASRRKREPMIVELGHFALVLALLVAVFQMVVPAWGAHVRDRELMATAEPAALCQFGLLMVAFLSLINALRDVGFLRRQRGCELAFDQAAASIASRACGGTTKARWCCGC